MPISNSYRAYNTDGTTDPAGSFAYWTDPVFDTASTPNPGHDTNPSLVYSPVPPATAQHPVTPDTVTPAPWVPPVVRTLEHDVAGLTATNPYAGGTQHITNYLADPAEEGILHMVNADPARTPTFAMFARPDYFLSSGPASCSPCVTQNTGFACDHGDYAAEINTDWLGIAGPGVARLGLDGTAANAGPGAGRAPTLAEPARGPDQGGAGRRSLRRCPSPRRCGPGQCLPGTDRLSPAPGGTPLSRPHMKPPGRRAVHICGAGRAL
jgi:hypothetical protein